mmetsp:Transcript_19796/g.56878  ORF Transcript_19796/g.56878 Transcript_19796/m.56878 type:complete len:204 (-) Transcript_19796:1532-2143(-)
MHSFLAAIFAEEHPCSHRHHGGGWDSLHLHCHPHHPSQTLTVASYPRASPVVRWPNEEVPQPPDAPRWKQLRYHWMQSRHCPERPALRPHPPGSYRSIRAVGARKNCTPLPLHPVPRPRDPRYCPQADYCHGWFAHLRLQHPPSLLPRWWWSRRVHHRSGSGPGRRRKRPELDPDNSRPVPRGGPDRSTRTGWTGPSSAPPCS